MTDPMLHKWRQAAADLGLEIDAPFSILLASGKLVSVRLRLRHFGAEQGMLVVTEFACIQGEVEALWKAGYGYSVMSEPANSDVYERENFIEVLHDWGWTGPANAAPAWYRELS